MIYFFEARWRGSSVLSLGDSLIRGLMADTSLRIPPGHEGVAWERAEDGDGGEEGWSPGAYSTPLSSGLHRERLSLAVRQDGKKCGARKCKCNIFL